MDDVSPAYSHGTEKNSRNVVHFKHDDARDPKATKQAKCKFKKLFYKNVF